MNRPFLNVLRKLHGATTPGPWHTRTCMTPNGLNLGPHQFCVSVPTKDNRGIVAITGVFDQSDPEESAANADFIAYAHTYFVSLLDEIETLMDERDAKTKEQNP